MLDDLKETNPKDKIGSRKWRQYCVTPARVAWEVGIALLVGSLKYGRTNWRVAGITASVYVDAAKGHIDQFWEGEDLDPESQAHHIAHAIAGLNILLDSILRSDWNDDRPPKTEDMDLIRTETQAKVDRLFEMYPDPVMPVTQLNQELDLPEWNGGQTETPPKYVGGEIPDDFDLEDGQQYEVKIQGDLGTYDTIEEWQKAEPSRRTVARLEKLRPGV